MPTRYSPIVSLLFLLVVATSFLFAQGTVTLLDQLDSYSSYASCWGYTSPDGREYALIGAFNGTSVVDITDGPNSYEVDFITGSSSSWRELKTYRHYGYVVNESGGGMQIIDLSDLPNSATLAATYTGFTTAHTVYIDTANAMLYCEGTTGQPVRVISLANPLSPVQLTTFGIDCHDMYVHNNRCYVAEGFQGTVGVYDVTNPASPTLLQRIGIPASGYVHNVWTTEDDSHFMTTEETSGRTVKMWDIQNLASAFITDTYLSQPSNLAHNVHIKGDLAYIAHYGDGLKIVDISDPTNIVEVGSYDTNTGTTGFVGAWGTYPYYASNKVIVSDISNGLFVLAYDEGGGIPCGDISSFVSRCIAGGTIRARIIMTNATHAGEMVEFMIDGTPYPATIVTGGTGVTRAQVAIGGFGAGPHTVELSDPAGCFSPIVVMCATAEKADAEWTEDELDAAVPVKTGLLGNYPNPFNPSTTINYELGEDSWVTLKIYNSLGQEVASLVNTFETAGYKAVFWNGLNTKGETASSGVYFVRMAAGNSVLTQRILLMK